MTALVPAEPSATPLFEATVTGGTTVVVLRGEFDVTTAGFLSGCLEQLRADKPLRLVFETAQVAFMDCASARLVAGTRGWLPPGVRPVISHPSPVVDRVLRASGIGAGCEIWPFG